MNKKIRNLFTLFSLFTLSAIQVGCGSTDLTPAAPGTKSTAAYGLCWAGQDSSNHNKLFCDADGTTKKISDLNSGGNDNIGNILQLNKVLFFTGTTDGTNFKLYKYDGKDVTAVSNTSNGANDNPTNLTAVGDTLYFTGVFAGAKSRNLNAVTYKLYKYDGSATVTDPVTSVNSGGGDDPQHLVSIGNTLYFTATADGTYYKVYKWDGSTVTQISDTYSGNDDNAQFLTPVGTRLYFVATADGSAFKLYMYDGSTTATTPVGSVFDGGNDDPSGLVAMGGNLYFRATADGAVYKVYEAAAVNTKSVNPITQVSNINHNCGTPKDDNPYSLTAGTDVLYFTAILGNHTDTCLNGQEGDHSKNRNDQPNTKVFKFDGTSVTQVSDTYDSGSDYPVGLVTHGDTLYFGAQIAAIALNISNQPSVPLGGKLFEYDGASVTQISNIVPASATDNIRDIVVDGSRVYFSATPAAPSKDLNLPIPVSGKLYQYDSKAVTEFPETNPNGGDAPYLITPILFN